MQKLDRINRMVRETLREMQDNSRALRLEFTRSGEHWFLRDGSMLLGDVAHIVIRDPRIVAVDHGLFRNGPGQTWRWRWCDDPSQQ
jgi:hypothetical protein